MKSKIKGNKKFAYILLGAGAIAMTGIAFSAWIITGTITQIDVANVSVTVGEVKDQRFVATVLESGRDYDLSFDCEAGDVTTPIIAGDGAKEDLSFGFTVTITNAVDTSTGNLSTAFTGYTLETTYPEDINDIVSTNKLIVLPIDSGRVEIVPGEITLASSVRYNADGTVNNESSTWSVTYSAEGSTLKAVFVFSFLWGDYFNGQNPGKYQESEITMPSVSDIDDLKAKLNLLKTTFGSEGSLAMKLTPEVSAGQD